MPIRRTRFVRYGAARSGRSTNLRRADGNTRSGPLRVAPFRYPKRYYPEMKKSPTTEIRERQQTVAAQAVWGKRGQNADTQRKTKIPNSWFATVWDFLLVPGAGQPYLLRPFRYGNKFQCLCNLLIMACYQKYALFINFWFCIWFCIRLSDKERMRLQHFRVLFCRDLDILHKVRFLFVPCNLHNGNSWNPGLICVCSE